MNERKKVLFSGFLAWLISILTSLNVYIVSLGGDFSRFEIYVVFTGFIGALVSGMKDLMAFLATPPKDGLLDAMPVDRSEPAQLQPEPVQSTDKYDKAGPTIDLVYEPELVQSSQYFKPHELDCKGMQCNCNFPGLSKTTLTIADRVRERFGPMVVNSAYRCVEHNSTIPNASPNSYHTRAGAIDLRPVNDVQTSEIYGWLCNEYPNMYGFGCYARFVHIDDRPHPLYGRKPSPEAPWRQHTNTEINLS